MAIRPNPLEYAFDTRLTALATNTTLGTATRHDFAAVTLHVPETSSRTFRSVIVEVTARDAFTVATSFTGVRIGIKLGAAAFVDHDDTNAQANTGDHETLGPWRVDVTSYFNTNFGAGASETCQVGVAFATAAASNVNNVTAKLLISYEYDDASATTRARTVRIPIQGHHTTIGTSDVEVGTTGGTSDAPVNQIPQLTGGGGFLPEASVTIRQAYIQIECTDGGNATTDFNLVVKIDSGGSDNVRATLEQALNTSTWFRDIFIYDTGTFSPATAHALILRSSLAATFEFVSAYMVVTYTYDDSTTTTECRSLVLPLDSKDGEGDLMLGNTATGDRTRWTCELDVQESATITIKQSGVVIHDCLITTGGILRGFAPGQTERAWTHASLTLSGPRTITRRTDHDSGWTLARGPNTLNFDLYLSTGNFIGSCTGYAIVNYHCAKTPGGNVSLPFLLTSTTGTAATITTLSDAAQKPVVPETIYKTQGVYADIVVRGTSATNNYITQLMAERNSGEGSGDGWWSALRAGNCNNELATRFVDFDMSRFFQADALDALHADVEATRRWRVIVGVGNAGVACVVGGVLWVTRHAVVFAVSGTVSGFAGAGTGIPVEVWSTTAPRKLLGSTTTTSGGAFSVNVLANTSDAFATAREDATHVGRSNDATPGSGTFDVDVSAAGGGGGDVATGSRFNRPFN